MAGSIYELFKSFADELDSARLQKKFLNALLQMYSLDRGSIWIREEEGYKCIEAEGQESDKVRGLILNRQVKSIVGWVIENGEMAVARAHEDSRHHKAIEKKLSVKSDLILAFPLFLRDKIVYGAVEIINTMASSLSPCLDERILGEIQELINIGSVALSNAFAYEKQVRFSQELQAELDNIRSERKNFIGESNAFQHVSMLLASYSATDYPVLVTGESGTGKEIVAHEIHRKSIRKSGPFVAQNCGAIPENLLESELFGYRKGAFTGAEKDKPGLFEMADGGTIFLDEIGELPLGLQSKILRVVQESEFMPLGATEVKKVNVRILSSTNRDLVDMVANRLFRQDLFYRLSTLPLKLPSLRERKTDIPLLLAYFLKKECAENKVLEKELDKETLTILTNYSWPGNIRELENFVKYITVVCSNEKIMPEDLPFHLKEEGADYIHQTILSPRQKEQHDNKIDFGDMTWREVEDQYIRYLLRKNSENVTWASEDAAVNRSTFISRMKKLGISTPKRRRSQEGK